MCEQVNNDGRSASVKALDEELGKVINNFPADEVVDMMTQLLKLHEEAYEDLMKNDPEGKGVQVTMVDTPSPEQEQHRAEAIIGDRDSIWLRAGSAAKNTETVFIAHDLGSLNLEANLTDINLTTENKSLETIRKERETSLVQHQASLIAEQQRHSSVTPVEKETACLGDPRAVSNMLFMSVAPMKMVIKDHKLIEFNATIKVAKMILARERHSELDVSRLEIFPGDYTVKFVDGKMLLADVQEPENVFSTPSDVFIKLFAHVCASPHGEMNIVSWPDGLFGIFAADREKITDINFEGLLLSKDTQPPQPTEEIKVNQTIDQTKNVIRKLPEYPLMPVSDAYSANVTITDPILFDVKYPDSSVQIHYFQGDYTIGFLGGVIAFKHQVETQWAFFCVSEEAVSFCNMIRHLAKTNVSMTLEVNRSGKLYIDAIELGQTIGGPNIKRTKILANPITRTEATIPSKTQLPEETKMSTIDKPKNVLKCLTNKDTGLPTDVFCVNLTVNTPLAIMVFDEGQPNGRPYVMHGEYLVEFHPDAIYFKETRYDKSAFICASSLATACYTTIVSVIKSTVQGQRVNHLSSIDFVVECSDYGMISLIYPVSSKRVSVHVFSIMQAKLGSTVCNIQPDNNILKPTQPESKEMTQTPATAATETTMPAESLTTTPYSTTSELTKLPLVRHALSRYSPRKTAILVTKENIASLIGGKLSTIQFTTVLAEENLAIFVRAAVVEGEIDLSLLASAEGQEPTSSANYVLRTQIPAEEIFMITATFNDGNIDFTVISYNMNEDEPCYNTCTLTVGLSHILKDSFENLSRRQLVAYTRTLV